MKELSTKDKILGTARELFYMQGFDKTKVRQISQDSHTNLGLISYYFKNKTEMGSLVYRTIREEMKTASDAYFGTLPLISYLVLNLYELKMAIENDRFYELFLVVQNDKDSTDHYFQVITDALKSFIKKPIEDENYFLLTYYSILGLKPSLILAGRTHNNELDTKRIMEYYLQEYIYFLGEDNALKQEILSLLESYYFDLVDNYTPIVSRIHGKVFNT